MNCDNGNYRDWLQIEYKPKIGEHQPDELCPMLKFGQSALEIGCGAGSVCYFLAKYGVRALGVDINPASIAAARSRGGSPLPDWPRFQVSDFVARPVEQCFDLVLMIRVLTCFSDVAVWTSALRRAREALKPGGMIWIHDFLFAPDNITYGPRYEQASSAGMRLGNFLVERAGRPLFVAHHHTDVELEEITKPYETVLLTVHESLSMHGNTCRMFRFLGRRPS